MAKLAVAPTQQKPKGQKKDQIPLARRLEHEVIRTLEKLKRLGVRYAQLDDPNATMAANEITATLAEQGVKKFAEQVADEAARKKGAQRNPVTVGSVVDIREKRVGKYSDLLAPEEMKGLTVTAVKGNKLLCETSGKVRVFLPKGDTFVPEVAKK